MIPKEAYSWTLVEHNDARNLAECYFCYWEGRADRIFERSHLIRLLDGHLACGEHSAAQSKSDTLDMQ